MSVAAIGYSLSPAFDFFTRLWLTSGFLLTDVMQHMLPMGAGQAQRHPSVLASIAESGFGIFIQTICPLLLAAGLFTRIAALALLVQVLVLHSPGYTLTAPYAAALLGWLAVLGPGALSLDDALRLGMSATALPFVGTIRKALASVTRRFGPVYNLLLRVWIAAALGLIALGQIHVLDPALSIQMGRSWLPQMTPMGAEVGPWVLLTVAASLALGLLTRVSTLLLVAAIPASKITPTGIGQLDWLVLLNLPLLGLPLFYGPGSLSVDHAISLGCEPCSRLLRRFRPKRRRCCRTCSLWAAALAAWRQREDSATHHAASP